MDRFRLLGSDIGSLLGKVEYLHNNRRSTSGAFLITERASVIITIPRLLGATSVSVTVFDETGQSSVAELNCSWSAAFGTCDAYTARLSGFDVGLYFYAVSLKCAYGTIYGYYSDGALAFSYDFPEHNLFQISISDFIHEVDDSLRGGVIYHIFVDRFKRGGVVAKKDRAVYVDNWENGVPEYPAYPGAPLKNNTFYGGTLYGIIDELPYIASLGTSIIYLSPIFDSVSNHKYDTADYMTVDPMFGGDEALRALIAEARKYDIRIILDGVFNHTGADSIYFNRYSTYDSIGAYQSTSSPYYKWYEFQNHPDVYTSWWGIEILPRINPDIPECREYFVGDGGVVDKYAAMGILGMRLDVVDELSDDFVADIKACLATHIKKPLLYGEVWEDASNKIAYGKRKRYYLGTELDGVMNYPVRTGIIDYLTTGNTERLSYALTEISDNAPKRIRDMQMNLLGTHDTPRILTVLGGESPIGRDNSYLHSKRMSDVERDLAIARLKTAYTILATLPGIPSIFYGDEAGLEGYSDPFNRMPYPWGSENKELLEHYRLLGTIRRNNSVYADGDFRLLYLDSECIIYARYAVHLAYITVVNNSTKPLVPAFDTKASALLGTVDGVVAPMSAEIFKITKYGNIYI